MTLLQMQYFGEVYRTGSTLQASQALHVSQSTISASVKALETELGTALFRRASKGMVSTPAGQHFYERSQEILAQCRLLQTEMAEFSVLRRTIRIGIPVLVSHSYWLDLYLAFQERYPEVEFRVVNRTVPVLLDMLQRHELDAVLFKRHHQELQDGCYLELHEETGRQVSMSTSHPLAREESVSYSQLAHDLVLRYAGDDLKYQYLQDRYHEAGICLRSSPPFDQFSTLIQFLRKNMGIAFLEERITQPYPDLVSIPIREETETHALCLAWTPESPLAQAPEGVFEVFRECCAQ